MPVPYDILLQQDIKYWESLPEYSALRAVEEKAAAAGCDARSEASRIKGSTRADLLSTEDRVASAATKSNVSRAKIDVIKQRHASLLIELSRCERDLADAKDMHADDKKNESVAESEFDALQRKAKEKMAEPQAKEATAQKALDAARAKRKEYLKKLPRICSMCNDKPIPPGRGNCASCIDDARG